MAQIMGQTVSDTTMNIALLGVGAITVYLVWGVFTGASRTGTEIKNLTGWLDAGWDKVFGAPEWAWRETLGQGGLGLTGGTNDRKLLGKDDDSWGWGYGPKKGWIFG